jgi:hypothetical protein
MPETIILHSTVDGREVLVGRVFLVRAEPDSQTGGAIITVKADNSQFVLYFVKEPIQEIQRLFG